MSWHPKTEDSKSARPATARVDPSHHHHYSSTVSSQAVSQQPVLPWMYDQNTQQYQQHQQYQRHQSQNERRTSLEGYYPPPPGYGSGMHHPTLGGYHHDYHYHYGYYQHHSQQPHPPRTSMSSYGSSSNYSSQATAPSATTAAASTSTASASALRDYSHASTYRSQVSKERFAERKRESSESQSKTKPKPPTPPTPPPVPSAIKASPETTIQVINSPPPTTLHLPSRNKNRDSIGSTLSRDSIGNISLAPSQLDSFELDLKSPTSMVISALLHGASMIATVDRPDEPQSEDGEQEEAAKAVTKEAKKEISDKGKEAVDKGTTSESTAPKGEQDKENGDARPHKRKEEKAQPPRAKRALIPTEIVTQHNLEEALANPIATIMENSELKRLIVIKMALQREATSTSAVGSGKAKIILPVRQPSTTKIMQPGFFWKDFPPLEAILYDSMATYYHHSNGPFTNQTRGLYKMQQAYNNSLVALIREAAAKHGYQMSRELEETDKHLRDRIRCFYKTHIQNAKKRLATLMKHDNPQCLVHLRALVQAVITETPFEETSTKEQSQSLPSDPATAEDEDEAKAETRKRKSSGSSSSSSSSANSVVGMVQRESPTLSSLPVHSTQQDLVNAALPPFDVQDQDVEPFFNLENDSVLVASAVSTRNVPLQGHGYLPPSFNLPYAPPTKKARPSPALALSSRVPNPIAERHAK